MSVEGTGTGTLLIPPDATKILMHRKYYPDKSRYGKSCHESVSQEVFYHAVQGANIHAGLCCDGMSMAMSMAHEAAMVVILQADSRPAD